MKQPDSSLAQVKKCTTMCAILWDLLTWNSGNIWWLSDSALMTPHDWGKLSTILQSQASKNQSMDITAYKARSRACATCVSALKAATL